MSRKNRVFKKFIEPDLKYNSLLLTRFINKLMLSGKKSVAQRIVYESLEKLAEKSKEDAMTAFEKALKNVCPLMEVRSRRVGGSTYQVPVEVRQERSVSLAMRWIVRFSRERSGRSMVDKLFNELFDAYNQTGASVKKREDTHKMADANKAFAHFRW